MPEFLNPFTGMIPARKLTDSELTRALRLNLSAEEEAVHLYQSHADATDNTLAKAVLLDIADEERVHAGEFQRLINILLSSEEDFLARGADEVNEMAKKAASGSASNDQKISQPGKSIPTIGNLKSN
jgi:rubrerythrin